MAKSEEGRRSPEPIGPADAGAPIFTVTIECPESVSITRKMPYPILTATIKVKYEGVTGQGSAATAKPVTFHAWSLLGEDSARQGFHLYRSHKDGRIWEECDRDDDSNGCGVYDLPDMTVHVAEDDAFVTLNPGETWTKKKALQGSYWSLLPEIISPGDVFHYSFKGGDVDWWDWGSEEDHKDTVVILPCWKAARVKVPSANDGRPKLLVPASNSVEFIAVE